MSTNNNLIGKEIRPIYIDEQYQSKAIKLFSGNKFSRWITNNNINKCTALPLNGRGITVIEDFIGFSDNLRRLDLSNNSIKRLNGKILGFFY